MKVKSEKDGELLKPPGLPQRGNGNGVPHDTIDVGLISGSYIFATVPRWDVEDGGIGPRPHDTYTVYFNQVIWTSNVVADGDQYDFEFDANFYKQEIPDGAYEVYYTVQDFAGNPIATSESTPVKIINAIKKKYPAPTFPDFQKGSASYNAIFAKKGVVISAKYDAIKSGDKVEFRWHGVDGKGEPVPASEYRLPVWVQDGQTSVEGKIPASYVLCLGPFGKGTANYHVTPADPADAGGDSAPASLSISFAGIDTVEVNIAQGAPLNVPDIGQGTDRVRLFGSPGRQVEASLANGSAARIVESTNGLQCTVILDEMGNGSFGVVPNGQYNVMLSVSDSPYSLLFGEAKVAGAITYGYTTGAAADDPMFGFKPSYCSVYLKVDNDSLEQRIGTVYVSVSGSAFVNGYFDAEAQNAPVPLVGTGTARFQIVDRVAEKITVGISLSANSPPAASFAMTFNPFPSWKTA